jgi:SAM-dependent methyltransferase
MPLTAHPWDTFVFYDTSQAILDGRPFYGTTGYSYPPSWAGLLAVVGLAYRPLSSAWGAHPIIPGQIDQSLGFHVNLGSPLLVDWLFLILTKTPIVIGDFLLAVLVRRTVASRFARPDAANRAFAAIFLNPALIVLSGAWGVFDVLPTYLMLVGTLLFIDHRELASGVAFGFAISLKYFPVLLALALVVGFARTLERRQLARFGSGMGGVLASLSAPFIATDAGAYFHVLSAPSSGSYVGRLSIWVIADILGLSSIPVWLAALDIVAIVLVVAWFSTGIGRQLLSKTESTIWLDLGILSIATFYLINRAVNPQYFIWIIPFLTLNAILTRRKPWMLAIMTATVLGYIFADVGYYSFFLPMLTIDPRLGPWVFPMPRVPEVAGFLSLGFWLEAFVLMWFQVRRSGGWTAMGGAIRSLLRALSMKKAPPTAGTGPSSVEPMVDREGVPQGDSSDRKEEILASDVPRCPLCEREGTTKYSELRDRAGEIPGQWSFLACMACGHLWLSPRPAASELPKLYERYLGVVIPADQTPHAAHDGQHELRELLFRLGGYAESDERSWLAGLRRWLRTVPALRHELDAAMLFLGDRPKGRVLDVGTGDGTFLGRMMSAGWEAWGVEAAPELASAAKDRYHASILEGRIEEVQLPAVGFDAVTLSHVIEHVADPVRVLRICRDALKPGGLLVAVTPNSRALGHEIFGKAWMALDPPRHFHLFSAENLERCASAAGLRLVESVTLARGAGGVYRVSRRLLQSPTYRLDKRGNAYQVSDLVFLLREFLANAVKKDCGEELVLIATRDTS